ncbi:BamA/TamA family outer membrane protein [Maricaulis sp.]|uniref:autotransporter assembly complex protein TamA n=1 Tax=Maricaulis sp. TaxID=1486257 RepID=UPI00262CF4D2|nr:BamA/TamA family outer membrane protein [Maricaulis sp.]
MRSILLPALALLVCDPAFAQPLAAIEGVDDAELRAALETAIGERSAQANGTSSSLRQARTAAGRARRLLRARGYYGASVTPGLRAGRHPVVRIEPGPQFHIASIATEAGEDTRAREVAGAALAMSADQPLQARAVIAAEARGLLALHGTGWPDATIGEREVIVDHATHSGNITFRFNPGPWSTYGEIVGDTAPWRPQFIARMSPFTTGAPADREEMLAFQRRLDALESVRSARISLGPVGEDGNRPVDVALTAAPRHSIETGLSYSTSDGGGGNARWTRRNLFGGDETLTLTGNLATLNQSLRAEISRPHWRRFEQTLFVHSELKHEDTDAYEQDQAEIGAEITRQDGRRHYGAGVRLDWSSVIDSLGQRDVVTAALDLVAGYDSRNDPLDPDRGMRGTVQLTPATTLGDCNCQYVRLELRGSGYRRLGENLVAATRLRLGSVLGTSASSMPADQRFYAGGGGSARGFDYQLLSPPALDGTPFGGTSVVETSVELRWRVNERWGAVGFLDSATAGEDSQPDISNMRSAVGMGVRYYFDFAPVRIDIATPLDRRDGEDPVQIYFSLGQAF